MSTLSDLTLKQLVAAYIGLTGIEVGPKFFNSRQTGVRRLEALMAEKNLTLANVLHAAGIETAETTTEPKAAPTGAWAETADQTDLQRLILTSAANRKDGALLPLPTSVSRSDQEHWIATLSEHGLVEEVEAPFWSDFVREDESGKRLMLRISDRGLAVIGMERLDDEIEDDGYGCEVEQVQDGDNPGTEDPPEPGMVWNELEQTWEYPEEDLSEAPNTPAPLVTQADPEPAAPSSPVEDHPAQKPPRARGRANIPAVFLHPVFRTELCERARDWLIEQGASQEIAIEAAEWLENAMSAQQPQPATGRRQPRTGAKQEILIALLRRPEGATLGQMVDATGWLQHTCRGALAGALRKRLGLNVISTKHENGERVYRIG